MVLFRLIFLIIFISLLSACASVTGTPNQSVSVQARGSNGKEVKEAACDLINKRGTWFITTPGTVQIHRSNDDLQVTCRKDGFDNGRASVVSDTKGSMFGNILLGGGIGAVVDHNNGSAYEYPSFIQVIMGTDTVIGTPRDNTPANPNPMGGGPASTPTKQELKPAVVQTQNIDAAEPKQQAQPLSQQEKLKQVKDLYDKGLITKEIYVEKQRKILESNQ
jgi:hypothetical protein